MPWAVAAAAVGVVGSAIVGGQQAGAAQSAADTQAASAKYAADIQKQIYDQERSDLLPQRQAGTNALNSINALMGQPQVGSVMSNGSISPTTVGSTLTTPATLGQSYVQGPNGVRSGLNSGLIRRIQQADGSLPSGYSVVNANGQPASTTPAAYSNPNGPNSAFQYGNTSADLQGNRDAAMQSFFTDPSYTFTRDQGISAIDRSAAARGILNSGATAKALDSFGSGLASEQYGNYFTRLQSLAGLATTATNSGNSAAQNYGTNAGNLALAAGDARASGYMNSANALTNAFNGGMSAINGGLNNWFAINGYGRSAQPSAGSYSYAGPDNFFSIG